MVYSKVFNWFMDHKKEAEIKCKGPEHNMKIWCLIGITKKAKAMDLIKSHAVHQVVETVRLRHSEKPQEVRDKILELCGDVPRIELFAREKVRGWDVWGNEVKSDIKLEFGKSSQNVQSTSLGGEDGNL